MQAGNSTAALASGRQAIQLDANRWEAYALEGGALMNLKRYEEAADDLSEAIKRAPGVKQAGLRDLRRQCVMAEAGATVPAAPGTAAPPLPAATTQAEIVLWKTIESSANQEDFRVYLSQYPNGAFVALAHQRLADLQDQAQQQQENIRAQAERQRAFEQAESDPIWRDPATNLMWQKQNSDVNSTWKHVTDYCCNLRLEGYSNWRPATIDELHGIYDPTQDVDGKHVKGGLHVAGWEWSSTLDGTKEAWGFDFTNGQQGRDKINYAGVGQALCVRDASNADSVASRPVLHRSAIH